jgi:hypothetical protein
VSGGSGKSVSNDADCDFLVLRILRHAKNYSMRKVNAELVHGSIRDGSLKRRRRWLTSAQGSSIARTLGQISVFRINPERVRRARNPFRVDSILINQIPGLSLRSNPGLRLANAFGV